MPLFRRGFLKEADKLFKEAENMATDLKRFWYFHQKELGDMLNDEVTIATLTTTLNNIALFELERKNFQRAVSTLK